MSDYGKAKDFYTPRGAQTHSRNNMQSSEKKGARSQYLETVNKEKEEKKKVATEKGQNMLTTMRDKKMTQEKIAALENRIKWLKHEEMVSNKRVDNMKKHS